MSTLFYNVRNSLLIIYSVEELEPFIPTTPAQKQLFQSVPPPPPARKTVTTSQLHSQSRPPPPTQPTAPLPPRNTLKSQQGTALGRHNDAQMANLRKELEYISVLAKRLTEIKAWGCIRCWGMRDGKSGYHSPVHCVVLPMRYDGHYEWQQEHFRSIGFKGPCWTCLLNSQDDAFHDKNSNPKCRFRQTVGWIGHLICKEESVKEAFIQEFSQLCPGMSNEATIMDFLKQQNTGKRDWIVLATHAFDWWYRRGKSFGH